MVSRRTRRNGVGAGPPLGRRKRMIWRCGCRRHGYGRGKLPRQKGREYFPSIVSRWLGASDSGPRVLVPPPGWDLWHAFKRIAYYDYSINEDRKFSDFGDGSADYSTDILKNRAVGYIKDQASSTTPFFMLITPKAPHSTGGEMDGAIPSPTYAEAFANAKLPMTQPSMRQI